MSRYPLDDDDYTDPRDVCEHCRALLAACDCELSEEQENKRDVADMLAGRKLTRPERLQGLADRGVDTWEEYRGER